MNDSNDPPRKFLLRIGQITPATYGTYEKQFDATVQAYKAMETIKAGSSIGGTGGVIMTDTFNRTASELVGSTSSGGQVWDGDSGGFWTADGSVAHSLNGPRNLAVNALTPNATITGTVDLVTSASGFSPNMRFYVGSNGKTTATSTTHLFAQLAVSTTGVGNLSVYKRINNVLTQLGTTDFSTGIPGTSATPQKATVKVELAIQNLTVTLTPDGGTPKVYTSTITEADYAALGTWAMVSTANNTADAARLDSITIETPYTPPILSGIEVWNGAVGGTNLTYQKDRLELLYPAATKFDILFVTGGHNKGTATPASFITEVDGFVAAFKVAHPETKIVISSQNPQKAPATTGVAHAARQSALRAYAMDKGYEYLPVFEAFTAQEDKGLSLIIDTDGIHAKYPGYPVANAGLTSLAWSGSVLWASVWLDAINARRITNFRPMTALPPA
ncbi:SGNH/GDSL hydrolase family protein [Paenarthrobacter sp. C1]|uniref:SGNH/GDSL hydrolase family protein n=1 Tax=Paenarthrobacter sp. C1 TaxID=3400220 RepID=UPI003BF61A3F